jgi:hypothetical protein
MKSTINTGRGKPRITIPFPVKVRTTDVNGHAFEVEAVVDNLSTGGLYMRVPRPPATNAEVVAVISLFPSGETPAQNARVAIRGTVMRCEPQADGTCGVAVQFSSYRFV